MAERTGIEWTDATWNPTVGCSIVSKGCTNCYAMKMAARLAAMRQPIYQGLTQPSKAGPVWTGKVELSNRGQVIKPLSWRRPRRIFVNSMSDLFHEALPDDAIDQVFAVMALCPQHIFQVLTKRPERMRDYINGLDRRHTPDGNMRLSPAVALAAIAERHKMPRKIEQLLAMTRTEWPLPNVWLGVSVEDQATADARIPVLLDTPAALRFISAEPLLAAVNLGLSVAGLDLVIAGAESGPNARPCDLGWIRSLRDQCVAAGTAFFWKQHVVDGRKVSTPELDGRRWTEMPDGAR